MKESISLKVCSILQKENQLRNDLFKIYNELKTIVEEEDKLIYELKLYETPKHLDMLNTISKELKMNSYIPKCIVINNENFNILKKYSTS